MSYEQNVNLTIVAKNATQKAFIEVSAALKSLEQATADWRSSDRRGMRS